MTFPLAFPPLAPFTIMSLAVVYLAVVALLPVVSLSQSVTEAAVCDVPELNWVRERVDSASKDDYLSKHGSLDAQLCWKKSL